jgi:3-oxoadipate enol-lactonase
MTLAHRVEGSAVGLPLFLIHPLGADQDFWDECRRHIGPDVLTVSCDLRGSGASPDLTGPLTLATTVEDIEDLRRHLGLDRMVMVGCAVGAMAAAAYAARHARHVSGLVMSNPGIRIKPAGVDNLRQRADAVRREGMASLLPAAVENAFVGYADTPARRRYEAKFIAQKPGNYAFACLGAAMSDITADCGRISCPALLVPGCNDRLFGREHSDEIAANIPQARVVAFAEGAHFIPYQQPEAFAAAVSIFLKEAISAAGA